MTIAPVEVGRLTHVERDPTWVLLVRPLRGTMSREEWQVPAHRQAAIDRAWKAAEAGKRADEEFLETPLPATLYCDPATGAVRFADIRQPRDLLPYWIDPKGTRLLAVPDTRAYVRYRTTYATWAEGPLVHIEPDLVPAKKSTDDVDVQRVRAQNRAIREMVDAWLAVGANDADMPRSPMENGLVDFRIRGVFKRRDYRVLVSQQSPMEGSKIITSSGVIE